jgi:hypothetical protein
VTEHRQLQHAELVEPRRAAVRREDRLLLEREVQRAAAVAIVQRAGAEPVGHQVQQAAPRIVAREVERAVETPRGRDRVAREQLETAREQPAAGGHRRAAGRQAGDVVDLAVEEHQRTAVEPRRLVQVVDLGLEQVDRPEPAVGPLAAMKAQATHRQHLCLARQRWLERNARPLPMKHPRKIRHVFPH